MRDITTTSIPFLVLADEFNVPYWTVLVMADRFKEMARNRLLDRVTPPSYWFLASIEWQSANLSTLVRGILATSVVEVIRNQQAKAHAEAIAKRNQLRIATS